ncbi:MAG: NAD(P)-dependent oxidoreductase [Ignavibacteria bacterium]|nr:NAD(P)-dependent oxidoreductase [Ignavibacteria bacterium]
MALPLYVSWKKEDIYETNIDGARNVLESSLKKKVNRVIHISSTAVYGVPDVHPLYEDHPRHGVGPYGESKVRAEEICEEYRAKGVNVSILRPKSFIGTARLGVFRFYMTGWNQGVKYLLLETGKNRYQLFEVEDLVDAILLASTLPLEKINDTFNVGAKEFKTVNEDVGAMCEYGNRRKSYGNTGVAYKTGSEIFEILNISPLYKWIYGTADTDSYVSIEKAEKQLGWIPSIEIPML